MADQNMKILVDVPLHDGHEVTIPAEYTGNNDTATEHVAEEMYQATLGSGIPGYDMTVVIDGSASDWLSDED